MYTIRTVQILIKLLPSILALRKDRKNGLIKIKIKLIQTNLKKMLVKFLKLLFHWDQFTLN